MSFMNKIALTTALCAVGSVAMADGHGCKLENGRVSIVGNEFPAIQTVARNAQACGNDMVEVKSNLTADHQKINLAGMQGNPAEYTAAIVANSSIVALMNDDVIRPLDDLVAKHGGSLKKNQLITIDGKAMAVAFMANAQHLVARSDVLEQIGVEAPTTYEELLAAAKMIRDKGIMENPVGGAFKAGWNLGQEFNNMYIGHGGEFFKPGTAEVSINNDAGVATLNMMKALTEYMNPDYLTHDSNGTAAEWKAGNVALMNMWGSRAGAWNAEEGFPQEILDATMLGGPLTVGGGDTPATTLWWDGWTVAKNISDEDAEATFIAMMNGISPAILDETTSKEAVWLIDGYEPTPSAAGVFATASAGAEPYPMRPFQGLLHTALGNELADFLQGKESAEQALSDIEAAYTAAAKEKGFLQ